MRRFVDGEEYTNGDEFEEAFCAHSGQAALWRKKGMPFIIDEKGRYLYPTKRCHTWFEGKEVEA